MILKHAVVGVVIALVSLWHQLHPTQAIVLEPASRGTLWKRSYGAPAVLEENAIYCGGHQHQELTEFGANFGKGEVTKIFSAGGSAIFQVDQRNIRNDNAYIEFKICPSNNSLEHEPQECFDRHPVLLEDGSGYRFYLSKSEKSEVRVKIPKDVTCNFCVLQYHIHEGIGEEHLERLHNRQLGSLQDFYGCSDIAIRHDLGSNFHAQGVQGPLIDGIIIKGAGNFGNIFGPGSRSAGTSNAWSQSIQNSGSYSPSSMSGGGYRSPLIKGIIVDGPGNFGNIYGANSVSSGTANAWSQSVANSQQGNLHGSQTVHGAFLQGISGPRIKGISINGASNFGNIFGPGSISSGSVSAWSQHITHGSTKGEGGPSVSHNGILLDINGLDIDNFLNCVNIPTTQIQTSTGTPWVPTFITDNQINYTETQTTQTPTLTTPTTYTTPPATSQRPSIPQQFGGIYGPAVHGIKINGPGNFGNIFGENSISKGNANAWSQHVVNTVNVLGSSSQAIGGAVDFGKIYGSGGLSTGGSNVLTQSFMHSLQAKPLQSAYGVVDLNSAGISSQDIGGKIQYLGQVNPQLYPSRAAFSVSR